MMELSGSGVFYGLTVSIYLSHKTSTHISHVGKCEVIFTDPSLTKGGDNHV